MKSAHFLVYERSSPSIIAPATHGSAVYGNVMHGISDWSSHLSIDEY